MRRRGFRPRGWPDALDQRLCFSLPGHQAESSANLWAPRPLLLPFLVAGVDEAWAAEVRRRIESIDRGEVQLIPWDDVMREMHEPDRPLRPRSGAQEMLTAAENPANAVLIADPHLLSQLSSWRL